MYAPFKNYYGNYISAFLYTYSVIILFFKF